MRSLISRVDFPDDSHSALRQLRSMLVENLIEHGNLYAALARSSLDRGKKDDALTALAKAHDFYLEAAEYASMYSGDASSEALDRLARFREKLDVLHHRFDELPPKAAWS